MAPVAPEIMPGRPPMAEVIKPIINAAYRPIIGSTPATNAKATASGTSAKATVIPESTSFFTLLSLLVIKSNMFSQNIKRVKQKAPLAKRAYWRIVGDSITIAA